MGKFSDALQKAKATRTAQPAELAPQMSIETNKKRIGALRIDKQPPKAPPVPSHLVDGKVDPRLVTLLEPNTLAAEYFKMLRAKLLFNGNGKLCRTIMVASGQALEGKTLVASNWAVSIAHGINEHVLLVDCDLRNPSLHHRFGLEAHQGLSTYLKEATSISPYLQKTPVEKMSLIPAGKPVANPSELLSSEKMKQLVEELKVRYQDRFVIFDTPPVEFTPEGNFLAGMVDGVILVVRSGKTERETVLNVIKNIGRERILGVVFNSSDEHSGNHRQYYRYYRRQNGK